MFKPLTARLAERSGFGGVSMPGSAFPEAKRPSAVTIHEAPGGVAQGPQPQPDVVARLVSLVKNSTADQREKISALIGQLGPLLQEAAELEGQIADAHLAQLKAKHETLKASCREQANVCERLKAEAAARSIAAMNALQGQKEATELLLKMRELEKKQQHIPRWATEEELARWEEALEVAKEKVSEADSWAGRATMESQAIASMFENASKKLQELAIEEQRVRAEITGESYTDLEFGLTVPGRP